MAAQEIAPQKGYQQRFSSSQADIVIGGGAAGVGKSYSLLLEVARHYNKKDFTAVFFRRTREQVKQAGGLWDTSMSIYNVLGGRPREHSTEWVFDSGAKVKFSHLQYEKDKISWQGSQITYVGFDELTHFSKSQFFYLLTRNRTAAKKVRPFVRATCNPDPDSWLIQHEGVWGAGLIGWWIDDDGFPIPERDGVIRYFTIDQNQYVWGDTAKQVIDKCPHVFDHEALEGVSPDDLIKSVTFIGGKINDNRKLLDNDPSYLGNLLSTTEDEKSQLLFGNWKIKTDGDELIKYDALNDSFTNDFKQPSGTKYITADIALHGSDRFVVFVWDGWKVVDAYCSEKTDAKLIVNIIEQMSVIHNVHRSNIAYDADGLGSYLKGYLSGAFAFNNNAKPYGNENYKNLKTQAAYITADMVNNGYVYITPLAASVKCGGTTIGHALKNERRVLKSAKKNHDGKLQIIGKEEMININGRSPDIIEAFIFRGGLEAKHRAKLIRT